MHTFCIHTLIDITENGMLKKEFPFKTKSGEIVHDKPTLDIAKNQQSNFITLIQTLQLRGNIVWEHTPVKIHENIANMRFGEAYEGKHFIWNFMWQVEQPDIYSQGVDRYAQLREDFNMIPVLSFCKETATFPASAFITDDPKTIYTYFTFVPAENK